MMDYGSKNIIESEDSKLQRNKTGKPFERTEEKKNSLFLSLDKIQAYQHQHSVDELKKGPKKPYITSPFTPSPLYREPIKRINSEDELMKILRENDNRKEIPISISGQRYLFSKNFKSTAVLPISEEKIQLKSGRLDFTRGKELSISPKIQDKSNVPISPNSPISPKSPISPNSPDIFFISDNSGSFYLKNEIEEGHKIHLAFLFACPFIMTYQEEEQTKVKILQKLEYEKEIELILRDVGEKNKNIQYIKSVATVNTFQHCLEEIPLALHFTGHGLTNDSFEGIKKEEGDILVFEDDEGGAQYFSCKKLKEFLKEFKRLPEFVFVSSCHSELVGEVFRLAGVKHVICVKRAAEIFDEVAIIFSQSFYSSFFGSQITVCEAFQIAIKKVQVLTAKNYFQRKEYKKFKLLTYEKQEMHDCYPLYQLPSGKPQDIVEVPEYRDIPSEVEYFVGRKTDLYSIICNLSEYHLLLKLGIVIYKIYFILYYIICNIYYLIIIILQ